MTKNKVEKMDEVTKESVLEALASMESHDADRSQEPLER